MKKLIALLAAMALAVSMTACGSNNDSKTVSGNSVSNSKIAGESGLSVSERIEKYEKISEEYNKNIENWLLDNNTPEEKAEYKEQKVELLSFSPESDLREKIAEQCLSIMNNDIDALVDSINFDCAEYYYLNFVTHSSKQVEALIDDESLLREYVKEELSEDGFDKIDTGLVKADDWPESITVDSLILTRCDLQNGYEAYNFEDGTYDQSKTQEKLIVTEYDFTLKGCEICGRVRAYQSAEHGDFVMLKKLGTRKMLDLEEANGNAKLAYTTFNNYCLDKESEGVYITELIEDGAITKVLSNDGLDIEETGEIGEGDEAVLSAFKDNEYKNAVVIIRLDESSETPKILFAQVRSKDDDEIIGQYPDPIEPEDLGKVSFGVKF